MSWSSLEPTKQQMYETNEDAITIDGSDNVLTPTDLAGTAVTEIYITKSKEVMKEDILNAKNLDANDSDDLSTLDDLVTYNETRLQLALSYLMLCNFYGRFNDGPDSQAWQRHVDNCNKYQAAKNEFSGLQDDTSQSTKFSSIQLTR